MEYSEPGMCFGGHAHAHGKISIFEHEEWDLDYGSDCCNASMNEDYENFKPASKELEELTEDMKLHPERYVNFSVVTTCSECGNECEGINYRKK